MSDPATLFTADKLAVFVKRGGGGLSAETARLHASVLADAAGHADLDTPIRVRHFMAQVAQETGGLRGLIEGTRYTNAARLDALFRNVQGPAHARRLVAAGPVAIGNTIYAHKNGNGGVATGDGYHFRGRGYLQVTGRGNYRAIGKLVDMALEDEPGLLGQPGPAARAAATYWRMRAINQAADADHVGAVTQLVNGPARLHLAERAAWLRHGATIWG